MTKPLRPLALLLLGLTAACASSGGKPPKGPMPDDDPRIQMQLGDAAQASGKCMDAIEHYKKSIANDPGNALVHNNLGLCLLSSRRCPEAEVEFRKALEINPTFADCRNNLGNALACQGKKPEAKDELGKAAADPNYSTPHVAWYNLGKLQLEDGEFAPAVESFRKAFEKRPDFAPACLGFGTALQKSGRLREAAAQFEKCAKSFNNDCEAHYELGACYYEMKRYNEAAAEFDKVIAMCPGSDTASKSNEYLKNLRER